jgi:hypothetical protein
MKKIVLISAFAIVSCILIFGCKKGGGNSNNNTDIPFQGPQNPSFENSTHWGSSDPEFYYRTGTGFLPSAGVIYIALSNDYYSVGNELFLSPVNFYQDNVDLSHSTTMTFDYILSWDAEGEIPVRTRTIPGRLTNGLVVNDVTTPDTVMASVLFTGNGTITLWQQRISSSSSTSPIQSHAIITLPSLPTPGRLLFQLTSIATDSGMPTGTFSVDNINVH